ARRDGRPALGHLLYARELDAAERGRDVSEVVLEAWRDDFVAPRAFGGVALPRIAADPVERHHLGAVGPLAVVGHEHPALPGGEGLYSVEGERGDIGPRADASSEERRRQRMSGVVDEHDVARARELAQQMPVAGLPADVDAD